MNTPHTAQIRQALTLAFDDVTLNAFCLDYFPNIYEQFAGGMRKNQKITLLLDHCRRAPTGFEGFLEAVRQEYALGRGKQNQVLKPLLETLEGHLKQASGIEERAERVDRESTRKYSRLKMSLGTTFAKGVPQTQIIAI